MSSSTDRSRACRQRQAEGVSLPTCGWVGCDKRLQGRLSAVRGVCSQCWKKTPDGKAETRDRMQRTRGADTKILKATQEPQK